MKLVTSIGPNRTERQQKCIASWIAMGHDVTAVQSPGETEQLKPHYPDVSFVETNLVGNVFSRPKLVRISALINEAKDSEVLVLNSDLEIRSTADDFASRWSLADPDHIKVGIRWEEDPQTKAIKMFRWGIDAFLITPQIAADLNDIGMTMGCPAWDYWIPLHLNRMGYKIITNKEPELIHETHPRNWSDADYITGCALIKKAFRLSPKQAAHMIGRLTNR